MCRLFLCELGLCTLQPSPVDAIAIFDLHNFLLVRKMCDLQADRHGSLKCDCLLAALELLFCAGKHIISSVQDTKLTPACGLIWWMQPGPENRNCYPDEHYLQTFIHVRVCTFLFFTNLQNIIFLMFRIVERSGLNSCLSSIKVYLVLFGSQRPS